MINVESFIVTLVVAAIVARWIGSLPAALRVAILLAVVVLCWLPWPFGWNGWILGYVSSLSVTTGLLAGYALLVRFAGLPVLPANSLRQMAGLLLLFAVFFYPASLGATSLDPFAWGYGNHVLSLVLLALGVLALLLGNLALMVVLLVAQLAWWAGLMQSDNVFDYLFDPFLVIWSVGYLLKSCCRQKALPALAE